MLTTKMQRHLAKQTLLRAARRILGDGKGDHSHWSRGYMFENDLGLPTCRKHAAAACMMGWIEIEARGESLVVDEARNMLDAYIHRLGRKRGFYRFLFTGRSIPIFNDEIAEDVHDASDALKQAALTG